jgi:23S rRNA (guanosine2251-2'-O)-methyltransferase
MEQVEGRNPVFEMLKTDRGVKKIVVMKGIESADVMKRILSLARKRGIPLEFTDRISLDRLSTTRRHQGIVAFVQPQSYASLNEILAKAERKDEDPFIIILDRVLDPQNLGSILRTAEGVGVHGILIPKKGSASVTPAVHRVSMGASAHVTVGKDNLFMAIKLLQKNEVRVVGLDASGEKDYFDADLMGPLALVIGGEDKGLSETIKGKCDEIMRIPMMGSLTSLNVGVACAIILYEKVRQDRKKQI